VGVVAAPPAWCRRHIRLSAELTLITERILMDTLSGIRRTPRVPRILVVDDEPDQRFLLRRIFERAGHEVSDAADGAAALAAVRQSPPDLVVTDMMMPVMDGRELIRRLRCEPATARIPILAASGDRRMAGAADEVVPKPYDWRHLVAVAEGLLTKGRGSR
jgi:CheY-like chemotaxis protein